MSWLKCPEKCSEDLQLTGNQRYLVSVQTSSKDESGTKDPIYIEFIGMEGKTQKKTLSEVGFDQGGVNQILLQNNDVGLIYGIKLCTEGKDGWIPDSISVMRAGSEQSKFDPKGARVGCPQMCCLTI